MPVVVLDQRGRITIPREIRERLGLRPGQQLEADVEGDRIVLRPLRRLRARYLLGLAGEERVSIEDVETLLGETS